MFIRNLLLLYLALFTFAACQGGSEKDSPENTTPAPEIVNEDDLMLRLSADLIAEPRTQQEEDKNLIISYAMDKSLNVESTPSGLYFQILKEGEGDIVKWGDRISVHYKGYFMDGKVFDSSYRKGKPIEFYVGNMIDGWNEGLRLLKPGGKALFLILSSLAYGAEDFKNSKGKVIVPANSVLIFELEVLKLL